MFLGQLHTELPSNALYNVSGKLVGDRGASSLIVTVQEWLVGGGKEDRGILSMVGG